MSAPSNDRRRPRDLQPDEQELWVTVTRSVSALKRKRARAAANAKEPPATLPVDKPARAAPSPFPASPPKKTTAPAPRLAPLERRLRQRIARGREDIDARIDLHGMTQGEAHAALARFLRVSQAKGARTVIVVTGKGRSGSEDAPHAERGVLRRLVPQWLHQAEFRDRVIAFEAAHVAHGGEGALYVRLRKAPPK